LTLQLFRHLLDVGHDAQQVSAPQLRNLLFGVAASLELERLV
jgi:hypothetical protein